MKTHLHLLGLSLAFALLGGVLSAAPSKSSAMMYPVSAVWNNGLNFINVGVADSTVSFHLGKPLYKPTENVWIYHRYVANLEEANQSDCHNLLLTFEGRRVSSIKLVNDQAVATLLALARKKGSVNLPPIVYLTSN